MGLNKCKNLNIMENWLGNLQSKQFFHEDWKILFTIFKYRKMWQENYLSEKWKQENGDIISITSCMGHKSEFRFIQTYLHFYFYFSITYFVLCVDERCEMHLRCQPLCELLYISLSSNIPILIHFSFKYRFFFSLALLPFFVAKI